jgi:hypothetical protein
MVYALLRERLERRAWVDRQIAGFALVLSGGADELPDVDDVFTRFDEYLLSPLGSPVARTPEQRALRRLLLGHE